MRILFVSPVPRAGIAQYSHCLLNALAQRGHQVAMATSIGFELSGFPRRYELLEVIDRYRPRPLRLGALAGWLVRMRPDIVHFQGAQQPLGYVLAWVLMRALTPAVFVYTPHDILPFREGSWHTRLLRLVYGRMAHVFLNAEQNVEAASALFGLEQDRVSVLPIPDQLAFLDGAAPLRLEGEEESRHPVLPVPPDRRLILLFGQIQHRKGPDVLVEAMPGLLAAVPNAHLAIVGQSHMDLGPLRARIAELGLGERVLIEDRYVSFPEMAAWFRRAEVVALPYRSGWNSGVVGNAFRFGKPVVAARLAGLEEAVDDGDNGLLVPPESPEALAGALSRLLTDDALLARTRAGASRSGNRSSWESLANVTEARYLGLLQRPPGLGQGAPGAEP